MDGVVVWLTGPWHAGKTTLAKALRERLGLRAVILDEDELHVALGAAVRFEPEDGAQFYGTVAGVAALLAAQGLVVIVAAAAQLRLYRDAARRVAPRFLEVFVPAPPTADAGRMSHGQWFESGAQALGEGYEAPSAPDFIARGGHDPLAIERLIESIDPSHPTA